MTSTLLVVRRMMMTLIWKERVEEESVLVLKIKISYLSLSLIHKLLNDGGAEQSWRVLVVNAATIWFFIGYFATFAFCHFFHLTILLLLYLPIFLYFCIYDIFVCYLFIRPILAALRRASACVAHHHHCKHGRDHHQHHYLFFSSSSSLTFFSSSSNSQTFVLQFSKVAKQDPPGKVT